MQFRLTRTIQKPVKVVARLFGNRAMLPQWQPGLSGSKQIESYPFHKYSHQLALGRRKVVMIEIVMKNNLPDHYEVEYQLKGIVNKMTYSFRELDPQTTEWTCEASYAFKGIMKLIGLFSKGSLKQQTELLMNNFKRFAESHKG